MKTAAWWIRTQDLRVVDSAITTLPMSHTITSGTASKGLKQSTPVYLHLPTLRVRTRPYVGVRINLLRCDRIFDGFCQASYTQSDDS